MKAASGDLPKGSDWVYELKWDGMRLLAFCDRGDLLLQSTNLLDVTPRFPELRELGRSMPTSEVILDGEVVAFGADGRPSFSRLQHRMHVSGEAEARRRVDTVPVLYLVFDLLHLDGHDLFDMPWCDRRALLEQLVEPGPTWRVPEVHEDGPALLAAATANRLEGVMAKRRDSRYEPGRRSPAWRKVKVRREQEFVVGGWLPGEGGRAGSLGSLLVGFHDGPGAPELRYAGRVGSGLTGSEIARLHALFDERETADCPFTPAPPPVVRRVAHWVRPDIVAQVAFGEWTDDDKLRHPSYLGTRDDVDAGDVVREP
jgi:bifunctional non-homologous end joining protein LigD